MASKEYTISLLDAATLLVNLYEAEKAKETDWVDADQTFNKVVRILSRSGMRVPRDVLESALYTCNIMSEEGKFQSFPQKGFRTFLNSVLPKDEEFDRIYNFIKDKDNGKA